MAKTLDSNICPICRDEIDFFSYGKCDHPTCARCAVKLRRFGSADEPDFCKCATCRARLSREVDFSVLRHEAEFDFLFENETVELFYKGLMACICTKCGFKAPSMSALNRHMTNEHDHYFCDLCLRHARMLPCEFVALSSRDLVAHRNWNKDKKRGHPACEFCNQTFYEFEDLVKHIREAHFLCDFCNAVGVFEVFRRQNELFQHYKESHHVCPECAVTGRMTCFSSKDQLGLHRMHEHPQESQTDPSRWEPLQIRYSNQGLIGQHGRVQQRRGFGQSDAGDDGDTDMVLYHAQPPSGPRPEEWTATDFPSLADGSSGNTAGTEEAKGPQVKPRGSGRSLAAVVGSGYALNAGVEDFPRLPGGPSPPSSPTAPVSAMQKNWRGSRPKRTDQDAAFSRGKGSYQTPPRPDDFPGLGRSIGSATAGLANWREKSSSSSTVAPSLGRNQQAVPTRDEFPSLGGGSAASSSHNFLPHPLMPTYNKPAPPVRQQQQQTKGKNKKAAARCEETSSGMAPDFVGRFGGALDRAQKSQWWNDADNDGAMKAVVLSENGRTPARYTRIQTIDSANPQPTVSSTADQHAPNFSAQEFPTLVGEDSRSQQEGSAKQKKSQKNQQSKAAQKKVSQPAKNTVGSNSQRHTEKGTLVDLEDTEIVLYKEVIYTAPRDFEAKNGQLIKVAEESLGHSNIKNSFTRFADLSRLFRYRQLTAHDYLQGLDGLLSHIASNATGDAHTQLDWLGSMIALLPEVSLQRALLRALKGEAAPRIPNCASPDRAQPTPPPPWANLVTARLQTCTHCGQVCLRTEMKEHLTAAHPN